MKSKFTRWLVSLLFWGTSLYFVLQIRGVIGHSAGMFLIPAAILAAWILGMWPGAILATLGDSIYFGIQIVFGGETILHLLESGSLMGFLTTILVATVVGKIADQTRTHKTELRLRDLIVQQRNAQARFLSLLNDIVQASLEAEDMQAMLKTLVSRTGELFNADECFITFWDEEKQLAIPKAAYGQSSQVYSSVVAKPGEKTLTASVLQSGHALVIEDPHNSPFVSPAVVAPFPDILSSLALPLIAGENRLGAIILSYHQAHKFSKEDIERGELAARQVSLAMTKVLLLEETRKRVHEITGLYEISQVFKVADDSHNTFGRLSEIMASLVDARICLICLYDPISGEIIAQESAYGLEDEKVGFFHYPHKQGEQAWDFSEQGIFSANEITDIPQGFEQLAQALQLQSVMVAPMRKSDQELLGMIFTINKPGGFNQDDNRLLGIFAPQAAIVIQNIQLIASEFKRNEELSILNSLASAATNSHNEDELISLVTAIIGERLFPDNFGILLLENEDRNLKTHDSYRLGIHEEASSILVEVGICGKVARTGETLRVADVRECPEYLNMDDRILSEVCVPIKLEGRVIGVVNAESSRLNAFNRSDEDLLGIIAGQLSTAIERLRATAEQARQNLLLTRANTMIQVLAEVGSRASKASNPEGVMHTLGKELARLNLTCLIALPTEGGQELEIAYTSIPERILTLIESVSNCKLRDYVIPRQTLFAQQENETQPVFLKDPVKLVSGIITEFPLDDIQKIMTPIGVTRDTPICQLPLVVDGGFKGVLWLWGEGLVESDLATMSIFASQVAIALQNAHLMTTVQKMALIDDLTGIFNRGHFFTLAEHEFSQSRRYGLPLSAIILDIDHFKQFNDQFGHIVGDQVLRVVAQTLQSNLRSNDILGRYGGEEFSILMPVTDIKAAKLAAQRLKKSVAETGVEINDQHVGVKISIGVSELHNDMPTLLSLINAADQAMYIAKSTGGDKVAVK